MGTGRNTRTLALNAKAEASWTVNSYARNLKKNELGAVIFGCKHHTYKECVLKQMFGLPAQHFSYVKNVAPGLALFLFNYSDRTMHGIFEAATPGQMNINPYAWINSEGTPHTPFAAQVRVGVRRQCRPIREEEFKPVIAQNYYADRHFWFELDKKQARELIKLFLSSPLPEKIHAPLNAAKWNNMFDVLPKDVDKAANDEFKNVMSEDYSGVACMKLKENNEQSYASVVVNRNTSAPVKKWAELFKISSPLYRLNSSHSVSQKLKFNSSTSDCFDMEWESASSSQETSKPPPQACPDATTPEFDSCAAESWEEHAYVDNGVNIAESWEEHAYVDNEVNIADSWEEHGHVDNEVNIADSWEVHAYVDNEVNKICSNEESCLQDDETENDSTESPDLTRVPSPENRNFESVVAKSLEEASTHQEAKGRNGNALEPLKNCESDQIDLTTTHRALLENRNALFEGVLADIQCSDFGSALVKLLQEIEGLKASELKQRQKVDFLEHELVHSKLEMNQLKKRCHKLESMASSASDICDPEGCESPDFTAEDSVLIVGGFDGQSWLPDLSSYSVSQDHVMSLCELTFSRSYASVAKSNGELYLFGGTDDGGVWYDTVESYNPMSNQWVQRPSLNHKKGSMAGASMYDKIYAIGGGNGAECFSEVEIFDINIGRWISTQSMHEKRFAPAAADLNGVLYVAGGYNGKDYLRSVERFDPREHVWTSLENMNSTRGCHSLVAYNEKLYALGGYDGTKMVSSIEVFDPRVGSWMMEEPMSVSRGYFGSFVLGGKIYAVGGLGDKDALDVVECYEEGSGWQVSGLKALGRRCFFSTLFL